MRVLTRMLPVLALAVPAAAADVLIVDPTGSQGFSQIQAAIDVAQDGDLILVRSGTYASFALAGRSLAVRGDVNAKVVVSGGVTVTDTPADGVVVLANLEIQGSNAVTFVPGGNALTLIDNAGFVRLQACSLFAGWGGDSPQLGGLPGGDGLSVEASPRTALSDCLMVGGTGGGDPFTTSLGGVGGAGVRSRTSSVVLYDCGVLGGSGGTADFFPGQQGGPGGPGCEVLDFGIFASSTTFQGGTGGGGAAGGKGGDGLVAQPSAQAQLLACALIAGSGGNLGQSGQGAPGQVSSGGGVIGILPGEPRVFGSPTLASDGSKISVEVTGEPGDAIWIVPGQAPAHVPALALGGVWLVQRPVFLTKAPLVVLGASGTATVELPVSALTAATPSRELFLQGFARSALGQIRLGSPGHVGILDCASLAPDCNGTGAFDTCDLLGGASFDCNANSIPDECEADCNGNGVADSCDVAPGGGSVDKNDNGVPDECEPHGLTWFVDDSAPAGGDGSPGAPFRTIGEGIAASLDEDTILVADGVYTGPLNRDLDFGGREIVVQSQNGSANCVIDCDDQGRAFFLENQGSPATRIEGFTILDGFHSSFGGGIRLLNAHTTLRDLVFLGCNGSAGGGLMLQNSDAAVSDCRFEGNAAVQGGGLAIFSGAPRVSRCTITGNTATGGGGGEGGGMVVASTQPVLLSHIELRDNFASTRGGALRVDSGSLVVLSHALLAGNDAPIGGAIQVRSSSLFVRSSTFAGNLASAQGAIFAESFGTLPRNLQLLDCVLWDDPAANGGVVQTTSSFIAVRVERCDVRGGQPSIVLAGGGTLQWGPGNIALDPLFADPSGPDGNPGTGFDNDLHLGPLSPCTDAGDNALVLVDAFDLDGDGDTLEPTPFDLDFGPRFVDDPAVPDTGAGTPPIVDMGAYERP